MIPLTVEEIATAVGAVPNGAAPGVAAPGGANAGPPVWPTCSIKRVTTDSRDVRHGDLFVAIRGTRHDGHAFVVAAMNAGATAALVRRDFRRPDELDDRAVLIAVDDTIAALGRLARYHRQQLAADVVAVTGSNGKTTTREMIAHVLSGRWKGRSSIKSYNNEIGVPLTLLSAEAADAFLVAEVGTNAPGEIAALARLIMPEVAVVTGVGPVHLERLDSVEGVAREKLSLLQAVRAGGCAIVNVDADATRVRLAQMQQPPARGGEPMPKDLKIIAVGQHESADLRLTSLRPADHGVGTEFVVNGKLTYRLTVPGAHNAVNALAAIAVGRRFGLTDTAIAERLATFSLPAMRLEQHRVPWRNGRRHGEICVINDAYNANPASVMAALDVLRSQTVGSPGRRVAVLGEMRELGAQAAELHDRIAREVVSAGIDVLVAVGAHAERMAAVIQREAAGRVETHALADADVAAKRIGGLCRPGDVVLIKGSRALGLEKVAGALVQPK